MKHYYNSIDKQAELLNVEPMLISGNILLAVQDDRFLLGELRKLSDTEYIFNRLTTFFNREEAVSTFMETFK